MQVDRRKFFAAAGGTAAVAALSHEDRAEALEHYMTEQLDQLNFVQGGQASGAGAQPPRGTGNLFRPTAKVLEPMSDNVTLREVFLKRFSPARHVMQSAAHAMKTGQPERTIFACLLHDVTQNLIKADHGYWGAQLFEPYVDERVSWGIRYHQALRFFPDASVGYEYPELYTRIFVADYEPDEYIKAAHEHARKHRHYMEARLITLNDQYAFDENAPEITIDQFEDIIGRQFKQPKEGLGYDGSPVAHMWRTILNPNRPL